MHELGLCAGVVDAVQRRAEGRSVVRVGVRVGVLHRVAPEAFEQAFAVAAAGTVAENAEPELVFVPVEARCRGCGAGFTSHDPMPACPHCTGLDVGTHGGEELMLEWLQYEQADEAGSAPSSTGRW